MRDWLHGLDPGFQRLRNALRALLAIALSVGALYGLRRLTPVPAAAMMLAGVAALYGGQAADTRRGARLLTTALLPWPLLLSAAAVALTEQLSPWIGYAILVLIVYAATEARRLGGRGMLLGMAGVTGFFLARLLHLTTAQLGACALSLLVAALVIMLVRELVIPDAPRATLRWTLAGFRAQQRRAAQLLLRELDGPARRRRRPGIQALIRLNACALAVEAALAAHGAGVGGRREARIGKALLNAELVIERCAALMHWGPAPPGKSLRNALAAVAGHRHATAAALARRLPQPCAPRPAPGQRAVRSHARRAAHPQTRQAVQATIACAAAIAVGQWLSPTRWYWALLAAFIVFAGTASTGETLQKIWARVLGTVLGVGLGVALVSVLGIDPAVDMALIVALALLGLYLRPVSYLAMTFCITMVLGLAYGLIGRSIDQLLTLRLEETAIGALFGGVAAMTLFPVPARDVMTLKIASYLEALDHSIAASLDAMLGAPSDIAPRAGARQLDGELHELLARAQPMLHPLPFLAPPQALADAITALMACSYFARALACRAETPDAAATGHRQQQQRIRQAIAAITAKTAPPASGSADATDAVPRHAGLHELDQIANIVSALAREPG